MIPRKKAAYRITRRAILFILTPALVSAGIARSNERREEQSSEWIKVTSKDSLVHLGSTDSFEITEGGTQAAQLLLKSLETKQTDSARVAIQIYARLIPKENFGGDYTALQWFSEYLLAPEVAKQKFLTDKFVSSYFAFLADNNFATLKEYLQRKYKLENFPDQDATAGRNREAFLEDFVRFNNPRREQWEKSNQIVSALNLKPGKVVADIGSGPGYYTFKFSELVGDQGRVFAIDTVKDHLDYVGRVSQKYGLRNIAPVQTQGDTIGLDANQVDIAFTCSLYHIIYTTSVEEEKDKFVESIKQSLKPDGTLVIVDNALVKDSELPYQGPYIAKELIIGQLKYYGFRLVNEYTFIPQRYVLAFKKA